MALDALCVGCLTQEINALIEGGRIDRIHQPEKDEITLGIRTFGGNYSLVLSAGAANPRVHFTDKKKKNPISAPLFCMLLRKHLSGAKIKSVRQVGFERIIVIDAEGYDELGDLTTKHLIVEIMGRHSNIILTNDEMKIIDSVKHVDITISSVRQVLPGVKYELPPAQDKLPLSEYEGQELSLPVGMLSKALISAISGISPLTAREIIYEAYGVADMHTAEVTDTRKLYNAISAFREKLEKGEFSPCIIKDTSAKKIVDFSCVDIGQYEGLMEIEKYESMNSLLDSFYSERDALERMKQKTADITKLLHTLLERAYKKRLILEGTINDAKNKDTYKMYGDLLTANVYAIEKGAKFAEVENFYDPDYKKIKINLDINLTAAENAQRYYKKYNKAKTAETEATAQQQDNDYKIEYLESTLASLDNCTCEEDVNAIRTELAGEGYLKKASVGKNKKTGKSMPMHFISPDGFHIYVGKNNTQNDELTLKFANSQDLWFHTKQIHGSHVIIKLGIDKDVPEGTILQAAQLAAYYSKARESNQVPVDYTAIKNVKKPKGAKPGMVIYDFYNTLYVTPKNFAEGKE